VVDLSSTSDLQHPQVDLFPLALTCRLPAPVGLGFNKQQDQLKLVTFSRAGLCGDFLSKVARAFGVPPSQMRLWTHRLSSDGHLLADTELSLEDALLIDGQEVAVELSVRGAGKERIWERKADGVDDILSIITIYGRITLDSAPIWERKADGVDDCGLIGFYQLLPYMDV
jgi:transposase-like protein